MTGIPEEAKEDLNKYVSIRLKDYCEFEQE